MIALKHFSLFSAIITATVKLYSLLCILAHSSTIANTSLCLFGSSGCRVQALIAIALMDRTCFRGRDSEGICADFNSR